MSHEYVLKPFTPEIRLNIDYSRELNEQQLAAVTAPPGPALVIAGAGGICWPCDGASGARRPQAARARAKARSGSARVIP